MRLNKSWRTACIGGLILLALSCCFRLVQAAEQTKKLELTDAEFKAVAVARLPPYIAWPPEVLKQTEGTIIIGVLGKEQQPFADLLAKLVKGASTKVAGRDVVVKMFDSLGEIGKPHILYVPASMVSTWQAWNKTNLTTGILTVGETEEFLKAGGAFAVSLADRQLEVNLKNVKRANLDVSSKLLKIIKRK